MLVSEINILPNNILLSLQSQEGIITAEMILQNREMLLDFIEDEDTFNALIALNGFGKGEKGEQGEKGEKGDKGEDARTMIDDNIVSTTDVWSSSKTNDEINKLLPLIYAGL